MFPMNKLSALALLLSVYFSISAQDITVSFQPKESETIDSILVTNLKTNQRVKILGNESLVLSKTTGIYDLPFLNDRGYIFPNPCDGDVSLNFSTLDNQEVELKVHNISGQLLLLRRDKLTAGEHLFKIGFPVNGIYTISIIKNDGPLSFKVVCNGNKRQMGYIEYDGNGGAKQIKNATPGNILSYTQGDILHYSCFSGKNNTILTDSPTTSKTYTVEFYECIDPDKQSYPIVKIGDQWWMAENLAYLPKVSPPSVGSDTAKVYYVYNYFGTDINKAKGTTFYDIYGVLYNWSAAMNNPILTIPNEFPVEGVCPYGWHIPGDAEWKELLNYLKNNGYGYEGNGEDIAKSLASACCWNVNPYPGTPGNEYFSNNKSGFSGLPGGRRDINGSFYDVKMLGHWWSWNEYLTNFNWAITISDGGPYYINYGDANVKDFGFSVRCIKFN